MNIASYRRIIEACFPELQVHSAVPVSQGWDSVALEVNDEYIFRFPKRPDVEPQYVMEELLLAELATRLPIAVPCFQFVWAGGAEYRMCFVGYRKLPGVPLACDRYIPIQLAQLAEQLAAFLSELHHFPIDLAVLLLVPDGDPAQWRQHYQQFYERVRAQVFPLLDASTRAKTALYWEEFLNNEAHFRFTHALIHRDLSCEHILCDPVGATIGGIIDWGDAAIGDPALDFVGLLHDCGADFTERVLAGYRGAVDATFRQRMRFYEYAIPFHEILFGITIEDEAYIRRGMEALRAALAW
jgi:aminoglycoside 2''-phosphotransferase